MLSFSQFISEATIRTGLPHIHSMDHRQFGNLIKHKKVHIHDVTEKTDGLVHVMGHDEHGFYTQSKSVGDHKVRHPEEYTHIAKEKAKKQGKPFNPVGSDNYVHIHKTLQSNHKLTSYLANRHAKTKSDVKVKGEVFYRPMAIPSEKKKGEIKVVGTSYDPSHMGSVGKYVLHTKAHENKHHDEEHFKHHLSNHEMNFDDDKIHHNPGHVDVSHEHEAFHKLNHDLLNSRTTKTNKEAKMAEMEKFHHIKNSVSNKVDKHIQHKSGIKPKWGSGSEGVVVHPTHHNPDAPRFKVTSHEFRDFSANPDSRFKKK